jgi:hypothetical protein
MCLILLFTCACVSVCLASSLPDCFCKWWSCPFTVAYFQLVDFFVVVDPIIDAPAADCNGDLSPAVDYNQEYLAPAAGC